MRKRHHSRQTARRPQRASRSTTLKSLYRRPLRYEPLEDRRLLALVTVNTLSDVTNFNDNLTTLREAIFATNLIGGADTIDFAPALTAGGPGKILLTQGEIKITDALTITGPGANLLSIDATPSDPTPNVNNGDGSRVFNIDDGNSSNLILISLRGLTLTGGDAGGSQGGGGIYSTENLVLTQSAVSGNAANAIGGGIHERTGTLSLNNSTISGNAAGNQGGGIYFRGDGAAHPGQLIVYQSAVSANNSGAHGGGIFTFRGDTKVTQSTISGNTAVEGGGLFDSGLTAYLSSDTISGNSATLAGGGIRKVGTGSFYISASTVSNNSAGTDGGGISLASGGALGGSNITLVGNTAAARGGGIASEGTLSLRGSTIRDGSATTSGGGVAVIAGTATLSSVTLQHNSAHEGGGLDLRGAGTSIIISASMISENSASSTGGGIYNYNRASLSITDSTLRNNTAAVAGGGLASLAANTTIFASTFNNNSAPLGGGIAGAAASNVLTITNSTISSNSASDHAAGIFSGGRLTLKHSTVTGNAAAHFAGGIGVYGPTEIGHTIVAGNTSGGTPNDLRGKAAVAFSLLGIDTGATITDNGGNLFGTAATPIDPKLGPLANNGGPTQTHALLAGSPAINSGDISLQAGIGGVPTFDQREAKTSRVFGGRIDIGSFEYQALSDLNLVVDTLVDESDGDYSRGDLSLREAIELANTWKSVDTIRFDPVLIASDPVTIELNRGMLSIIDSVSIIGPGANLLTIDGKGNDPTPELKDSRGQGVFFIVGAQHNSFVNLSGLTVTGGDSRNYSGIYVSGTTLSLNKMTISGNANLRDGGGVFVSRGSLNIDDCIIANNSARQGAGLFSDTSTLNVFRSNISDNMTTGNFDKLANGGGIFFSNSSGIASNQLLIAHSTVSGNATIGDGAGIWVNAAGSRILIADSRIEANRSTGPGSRGGGIYVFAAGGLTQIDGSIIRANSSGTGGGAHMTISRGDVTLSDCIISGNTATADNGQGGGIVLLSYGPRSEIVSSTISFNSATGSGSIGGGLYAYSQNLRIEDSTITGNTAEFQGGGIFSGGTRDTATFEISNSIVSNNGISSANGNGGGVATKKRFTRIAGSTIAHNSTGNAGGGITLEYGELDIQNSALYENQAGHDGGGIYLAMSTSLIANNITVSDNLAGRHGGGIATNSGDMKVRQSTFSNNHATGGNGGALWLREGAVIEYSTITLNTARDSGGGAFGVSGLIALSHTNLATNTALAGPDLTGLLGASFTAQYCLIGSSAGSGLTPTPVGTPDAHGNLIGGETAATIIDPMLGPLADNGGFTLPDGSHILTHALLPDSPAINAGDLNLKSGVNGVPEFDERGTTFGRVVNGRIDIGAFEYQAASDLNLVVDTLVDESDGDYSRGDLSLREAIELANLWPSIDTIRFDPALTAGGPATILLTQGELKVTDSVTINGPGADVLTIDASGNDSTPNVKEGNGSRIFNIDDGNSPVQIDVSLTGLMLTGGDSAGSGGAISSNEALSLFGLMLKNNSVRSDFGQVINQNGGSLQIVDSTVIDSSNSRSAVATTNCIVSIRNTTFAFNSLSTFSGTLFAQGGTVDISRSSFLGNSGSAAIVIWNGILHVDHSIVAHNLNGIIARSSDVAITDTTISNNSPSGYFSQYGGGVDVDGGTLLVERSEITDNATLGVRGGGGIFTSQTQVTIADSSISRNRSRSGSAIKVQQGTASILGSTISDNVVVQPSGRQGTICAIETPLTIRECTITGNTTEGFNRISYGIVANVSGSNAITIEDTEISNNEAGAYLSVAGGLVSITNSSVNNNRLTGIKAILVGDVANLEIADSTISGNGYAWHRGGIYVAMHSNATTTISSCDISNNTAFGAGGGIFALGGTLTIDRCTVHDNVTKKQGSGAIDSTTHLRVTNSTISNNVGGGISHIGNTITVTDCVILGNTTTGSGGGLAVKSAIASIARCTIMGNSAAVDGGGIWYDDFNFSGRNLAIEIRECTISSNSAGNNGGGASVSILFRSPLTIDRSSIQDNTAGQSGGGIYKRGHGTLELGSTTISGNSAAVNGGGISIDGVVVGSGNIEDLGAALNECTVSGNTAGALGGGIWVRNALDVQYSTITKNKASAAGGGIFASYGPLTLDHTIVAANTSNTHFNLN